MRSRKKTKINEQVSSLIQGPLKYIAFIDAGSYISRGNGLLTVILKDMGTAKISRLFRPLSTSETYKTKEQEFKALSSRFASNPSLKTLYIALNKLKSSAQGQEDTTQIQKDIQLLVNRIGKTISTKLTDEEKELFDSISSQLDPIARTIGNSIDTAIEPTPAAEKPEEKPDEKSEEKPEEKPAEEPKEEPSTEEKPEETPAATEPATSEKPEDESEKETTTKKEHIETRIKRIVREIMRKSLSKK